VHPRSPLPAHVRRFPRAHGFGAPENSRAAITRAVEAGVPLIKIDVRASKERGLFLLHDGKLDRATTLRGRVEGFTSAELAGARLANGETLRGSRTPTRSRAAARC